MKHPSIFNLVTVFSFLVTGLMAFAPAALAALPMDWELGLQPAASPVKEHIHEFHDMLLVIITGIVLFVLGLLIFVCFRFRAKANPTPSTTTHNTLIEVVWTIVPVIILIIIAVPSFKLIYYSDRSIDPEMTLKVTGYQWYWGYEYPDQEGINFLSYMVPEDQIDETKGQKRLLDTDNAVVLPVDTDIQVLVTAADVIHSWAVPALGVKKDAVPGRLNETWLRIDKPGIYYGQCSEICGTGHAYMPIMIKAVSKEDFQKWVAKAKKEFAANDNIDTQSFIQLASK